MKFKRAAAAALGVLTLLPLLYLVVFVTYFFPTLSSLGHPGGIAEEYYFDLFNLTFRLWAAAIVLALALLVFYGVFAHRANIVPIEKRSLWVIGLLVGHIIVMPVFWYLYVWRRRADLLRGP